MESRGMSSEELRLKLRKERFAENSDSAMVRKSKLKMKQAVKQTKKIQDKLIAAESGVEVEWSKLAVKGTCKKLEKSYFRLTSAADPSTVRPQKILEKALNLVCQKVESSAKSDKNSYFYAQDQLKAIRQDCTVQHIRNEFTVRVYETHARMAIEYGDTNDFNQCQSQVIALYGEGLSGCHAEFLAYRILYQICAGTSGQWGDVLKTLSLSAQYGEDACIQNALQIRHAIKTNNFVKLFSLVDIAPNLGKQLINLFIEKLKFRYLQIMCKAFKPNLSIVYASKALGFFLANANDSHVEGKLSPGKRVDMDPATCFQWLKKHGVCFVDGIKVYSHQKDVYIDCKASMGTLFIPEDKNRVSHGDANLAIDDFLRTFN